MVICANEYGARLKVDLALPIKRLAENDKKSLGATTYNSYAAAGSSGGLRLRGATRWARAEYPDQSPSCCAHGPEKTHSRRSRKQQMSAQFTIDPEKTFGLKPELPAVPRKKTQRAIWQILGVVALLCCGAIVVRTAPPSTPHDTGGFWHYDASGRIVKEDGTPVDQASVDKMRPVMKYLKSMSSDDFYWIVIFTLGSMLDKGIDADFDGVHLNEHLNFTDDESRVAVKIIPPELYSSANEICEALESRGVTPGKYQVRIWLGNSLGPHCTVGGTAAAPSPAERTYQGHPLGGPKIPDGLPVDPGPPKAGPSMWLNERRPSPFEAMESVKPIVNTPPGSHDLEWMHYEVNATKHFGYDVRFDGHYLDVGHYPSHELPAIPASASVAQAIADNICKHSDIHNRVTPGKYQVRVWLGPSLGGQCTIGG
jgi:hypothetical protein